jgi:hypothetical protein
MSLAKLLCICAGAVGFHISLTAPDAAENDRVVCPNQMEMLIGHVNVLVPRFLKVRSIFTRTPVNSDDWLGCNMVGDSCRGCGHSDASHPPILHTANNLDYSAETREPQYNQPHRSISFWELHVCDVGLHSLAVLPNVGPLFHV